MALIINTPIENQGNQHLLDAKNVKGTYVVVATTTERDNLPEATRMEGSLCYCQADDKFYIYTGSAWVEKIFGTTNAATQSAAGLMSAADKKKLDGVAEGATNVTIDTTLSDTSVNPVENKAIKEAIDNLSNRIVHKYSVGLEFTSNGDGTCYVSGIGSCTDTDIVIPTTSPDGDSVTSIGYLAFLGCEILSSVVISDSVTTIGDCSFQNCSSLTSVVIPDSVTTIGSSAFRSCSSLTSITIPDSVTSIGTMVLMNCTNLVFAMISNSVTSIPYYMFSGCSNLTEVIIGNNISSIVNGAFSINNNGSVNIYYTGTEEEWNSISIGTDNECLTNATIHYNYAPDFKSVNEKIDNISSISNIENLDINIKLSETIWTDKTIGHIEGTVNAPKIVANQGDTLKTMFNNIFGTVEDDDTDLVTNPCISAVSVGNSSYEYGTKIDLIPVTITAKSGSYKYGPDVEGAGWNGNYTLSGTGFTTKNDSDAGSQNVTLNSTFTVGSSSALTLTVSRNYNAATNTANTKMGASTTQTITAGTATQIGTFNPTAKYYQYWGFTAGDGITPNLTSGNSRLSTSGQSLKDYTPESIGRLWFFDRSSTKTIKQYLDGMWVAMNTGKVAGVVSLTLDSGATADYYAYYTDELAIGKSGEYALK